MLQAVCRVDLFWYVLDESEFEGKVQAYKIEYYNSKSWFSENYCFQVF